MKTISIQQPWASLVACGVKDVENRTTRMVTPPKRLLIHVGTTSRIKIEDFPMCWFLPVENAEILGQYKPELESIKSAIIGYVDVVDIVDDSKSVWAQYSEPGDKPTLHYILKNAHLFREPILGVKGKLGIWDYPDIDENNLPETVEIPQVKRDGKTITFPCSKDDWDSINEWKNNPQGDDYVYFVNLLDNLRPLLVKPSAGNVPLDTTKIVFMFGDKTLEQDVDEVSVIERCYDDNGEKIVYDDPAGNTHQSYAVEFLMLSPKKK
jgi:hypothetical protein